MATTASTPLHANEWRAIISLSSIMSLRMIGLFMVLPLFSLYAIQLIDATPLLVGIAMGIYGLVQALFQIPFGVLSDRFGRKPLILIGLLCFAIGSLIAGLSDSIWAMIIGRSLQGVGAIGSSLLALMADLTRETQRTKAMAIAGMTIGLSFSLAILIGPLLGKWFPVNILFLFTMAFAFLAIFILYTYVPTPSQSTRTIPDFRAFLTLLLNPQLARLNGGIFLLHAIFTASFIIIPISLYRYHGLLGNQQWFFYLPTLGCAAFIVFFGVRQAERKQQIKMYFLCSILMLIAAESCLWLLSPLFPFYTFLGLCLFFSGFSLLEAFMPSLISRLAPATYKGTALGIYSCSQFLGIFAGGALGGWMYEKFNFTGVYLFCIISCMIWFIFAFSMRSLQANNTKQHLDFIPLKEQLQ